MGEDTGKFDMKFGDPPLLGPEFRRVLDIWRSEQDIRNSEQDLASVAGCQKLLFLVATLVSECGEAGWLGAL